MSYAINFQVYTKSPVILSAACLLLVCLVCSSSLIAAKEESERSPREYRELGVRAAVEKDFKTSLKLLGKAIAGDPQDGVAYYYRGAVYHTMGEYDRAIQDYDQAIKLAPELLEPWVERAAIWIIQHEMQNALRDIDHALSVSSTNARAYFLKGLVDESRGNYNAAIEDYDSAIAYDYGNWSYLESRAMAFLSLGEKEKALQDFNEAISKGGQDVSASVYAYRAFVRRGLGQVVEAVADYSRALKIDPGYAPAIYGRGLAHGDLGERAEAIADFSAYLAKNPDYIEAYKERGIHRALAGDYDGAISDLDRCLAADREQAETHYYLAMARHSKGDLLHATKEIDRAIDMLPDNAEYYFLRSAIRLDANNLAGAGQDYDQGIFLKPELGNQRVKTRQADPTLLSRRPQLFSEMDIDKQPRCLALSPDGRSLVTGGESQLMIWDVGTQLPVRRIDGKSNSLAYSPDGKTVLAGHAGGATFWDPVTGGRIASVPVPDAEVDYVEFSKKGRYFGLGTRGRVLIFEGNTRQLVGTFKCFAESRSKNTWMDPDPPSYRRFSFTPDEHRIVVTSRQGAILWDIASGGMVKRIGDKPVYTAALSPQGDVLFLGSTGTSFLWGMDGNQLWALSLTQVTRELDLFTKEEKNRSTKEAWTALARFSDDGSTLAATFHGEGGLGAIIIDVKTGNMLRQWSTRTDDVVLFRDGSHMIASVAALDLAFLVEVRGDEDPGEISGKPFKLTFQKLNSVGFSPKGDSILLIPGTGPGDMITRIRGKVEGTAALPAILWDLRTCQEITRLEGIIGWTHSLAFNPRGDWVATGGGDGLRIWELPSGAQLHYRYLDTGSVDSVSVSPQGDYLLAGGCGSSALLLKTSTWNEVRKFEGYDFYGRPEDGEVRASEVKCAVFSPDGHQILAASGNLVLLWERETGKEIQHYFGDGSDVKWVEFHPKGELFASVSDNHVRLVEVSTGKERWHVDVDTLGGERLERIAFRLQGDFLIASNNEKSFILRTKDGSLIRKMTGGGGIFSPNGRLILTCRGGVASLADTKTGGEVCRFHRYRDGVLAVTGGLYYTAPRSVLPFISFRVGDRSFPFEQMDIMYNRPDIVAERIGVAPGDLLERYRKAYHRRLDQLGISEQEIGLAFDAPEIAIISSVPLKVPATAAATLTVRVRDGKFPLTYLHVSLNGVPVRRVPIGKGKEKFWEGDVTVQLGPGDNHVQLQAFNQQGAGSLRETVLVNREHSWMKETDLYIAAVGISEYHDRKRKLQYAAKDATDMAQYFQANPGPYRQIHALVLTNDGATRESVVSQTRAFFERATVNDHVILFFAGHGLLDKKLDYWFGTADMDFDDPSSRGLSYQAIETLLTDIAPLRRLLLVDTCNAGEIDTDAGQVLTVVNETQEGKIIARGVRLEHTPQQDRTLRLLQTVFADLREGTGAHVLAASGGMEFALESPEWKNGVFTSAVLRAIRDKMADRNKDGYIQVSELKDFVVAHVQRLTRKQQEPTARRENPRMDFVVH